MGHEPDRRPSRSSSQKSVTQPEHLQPLVPAPRLDHDNLSILSAPPPYAPNADAHHDPVATNKGKAPSKTSAWYHGVRYDNSDMVKAVNAGDLASVKKCLKAGLNPNHCFWVERDPYAGTGARSLADVAASRNDMYFLRALADGGADLTGHIVSVYARSNFWEPRYTFDGEDLESVKAGSWTTPLHQACSNGHVNIVRYLLQDVNVNPNTMDARQRTGLFIAAKGKSLDLLELLLGHGAACDTSNVEGITPLAAAAYQGRVDMVELLLDHGAQVDAMDKRGETALFNAALVQHHVGISTLMKSGASIDMKNLDGKSAFFMAASRLKVDTLDMLTQFGADTDCPDNNGCTALLRAVMARNIQLVKHLLYLGADIDKHDDDGWTPLFAAMIHRDEDLVRLLLATGPNLGKTDTHGNTTLHQAAMLGSTQVIRHILAVRTDAKIDHSQANMYGETALELACKYNHSPAVKVLLKHGVDPRHIDVHGYRAIDRAMYWGSHACVLHLFEAGVDVDEAAVVALQHGMQDHPDAGLFKAILARLPPEYQVSPQPESKTKTPLYDLFARSPNIDMLRARMCEKQGKIPTASESQSTDPFEACIPNQAPTQIIVENSAAAGGFDSRNQTTSTYMRNRSRAGLNVGMSSLSGAMGGGLGSSSSAC